MSVSPVLPFTRPLRSSATLESSYVTTFSSPPTSTEWFSIPAIATARFPPPDRFWASVAGAGSVSPLGGASALVSAVEADGELGGLTCSTVFLSELPEISAES